MDGKKGERRRDRKKKDGEGRMTTMREKGGKRRGKEARREQSDKGHRKSTKMKK